MAILVYYVVHQISEEQYLYLLEKSKDKEDRKYGMYIDQLFKLVILVWLS